MDCGCLATGLPLLCEVVIVLPRWRLYWLREEFGTPSGLEILFGEGGDAELGARTSEHILLFAFDPLVSKLYLFYLCKASFISYHSLLVLCLASFLLLISSLYAWLVFVCLTCT